MSELAVMKKLLTNEPRVVQQFNDDDDDDDADVEEAESGNSDDQGSDQENENDDHSSVADEEISDASDDTGVQTKGNAGWADAMRKILNTKKPKRKKTIVLSKAKKLNDVIITEKKQLPFQIQKADGDIKVEEIIKVDAENEDEVKFEHKKQRRKDLGIRVKPSISDRGKERLLQKIATKGVVQLFNAVRQQQLEITHKLEDAGPVERKREQVLKNIDKKSFLDVLMGGTKSIAVEQNLAEQKKEEVQDNTDNNQKVWSVLRDDFAMGANLKDWNKKDSESEQSSAPEEMSDDE